MATDRAIGRYRRWYARLLRLFPRPYHERFGEPMEQTFTDLCRERRDANRGLHGFALGTFAETSAGIMRENMTHIVQNRKMLRWVLATALLLLVPLVAMLLQIRVLDPGGSAEAVNWGPLDFVLAGVLLPGTGFLYELATRQAGHVTHRIAVGIAVAAALLLVWINLAVGMIGDEANPANLLYVGVLASASSVPRSRASSRLAWRSRCSRRRSLTRWSR